MLKPLVATALLLICACDAYKILVIFPMAGKSHSILGQGIVRHLLNAGHEVTLVTSFDNKPQANLTTVSITPSPAFSGDTLNIEMLMKKEINMKDLEFVQQMMMTIAKDAVSDPNTQKMIKDKKISFDLVIAEWMFIDLYSVFGAVYECPFIWFSSLEPHWMITRTIDEYLNPAYNADLMSEAVPPFTFTERLQELWTQITGTMRINRYFELEKQVYESVVAPVIKSQGRTAPVYDVVVKKVSLVLSNSHVSMGIAPRLPQNYINIGGYHIDTNVAPLPADLQKILDNAKNGAIYFSMGSNLKSKDIPEDLKKGFLEIFRNLKQTVIWKFEEVLPNLPKNVHILKWAPQPSILAHPNVILFITHGGLLSTTETIHFGKPMIGIPVFADQFANVKRTQDKGFGKMVELSYNMDKDLKVALDEVLGNPTYTQKAKEWSFIYHDRIASPGRQLVHAVEHVVRTNGAKHLRSHAFMMPWYQKFYLDFLAIVLAIIVLAVYGISKILGSTAVKINKKQKKL